MYINTSDQHVRLRHFHATPKTSDQNPPHRACADSMVRFIAHASPPYSRTIGPCPLMLNDIPELTTTVKACAKLDPHLLVVVGQHDALTLTLHLSASV